MAILLYHHVRDLDLVTKLTLLNVTVLQVRLIGQMTGPHIAQSISYFPILMID